MPSAAGVQPPSLASPVSATVATCSTQALPAIAQAQSTELGFFLPTRAQLGIPEPPTVASVPTPSEPRARKLPQKAARASVDAFLAGSLPGVEQDELYATVQASTAADVEQASAALQACRAKPDPVTAARKRSMTRPLAISNLISHLICI